MEGMHEKNEKLETLYYDPVRNEETLVLTLLNRAGVSILSTMLYFHSIPDESRRENPPNRHPSVLF